MPLCWYAITSKIKTKDKFLKEIKKSPPKSKLKKIKNVIIYDFETDNVDSRDDYSTGLEDSLLKGYALIQLDDREVRGVIKDIESHKIGKFVMPSSKEVPYPVPQNQVVRFQSGVKKTKEEFTVGDKVKITDGILKGFEGVIVRKNKLMVGVEVQLPNSTIIRSVNIVSLEKKSRN
jgi:transcription antitermination factor NusG